MKLICVFVFAYAKSRFSLDAAHIAECMCVWISQRERAFGQVRVGLKPRVVSEIPVSVFLIFLYMYVNFSCNLSENQ